MSLPQRLWLALGVAACHGDAEETAPAAAEVCDSGAVVLEDGRCLAAGRQPNGCAAGELALEDGTCQPPGVPPSGCATGFVSDDAGGCIAVHPGARCPPGSIALLGERACHAIVDCGAAPWGDIPVRAGTVYVDANSSAIVPDGSVAKPWPTIQQAIDAAARGGMIAIAAGTYNEDLVIEGKPVALWGRCPELVDIRGSTATFTTLLVTLASGTEIHRVGVTGPRIGVLVTGAEDVIIDRSWIHHTGGRGLDIENTQGPTSARVTHTLVESAQQFGFMVLGSDVEVELSEVRANDVGIAVEDYFGRSHFALVSSIVAENRELGAYIGGSDGVVEASWVHDTKPSADLAFGWGVSLEQGPMSGELANISLKSIVTERNHELGLDLAGGAFDLEHVVVRDTAPSARDGLLGWGIELAPGSRGAPATVAIRSSTVERSHDTGIALIDSSKADIAGVLVRDVFTRAADGQLGIGIGIGASEVTLRSSLIEHAHTAGVLLTGGEATLEGVAIRDNLPRSDGVGGMGIASGPNPETAQPSSLVVRWSRIERCLGFGMLLRDPFALVEGTVVTDTNSGADGLFGDNVAVISHFGPATAAFSGAFISTSERAGIANFGANIAIERTRLDCNAIDLDGEVYAERPFVFEAATDNDCSCHGVAKDCKVLSASLAPPEPLDR